MCVCRCSRKGACVGVAREGKGKTEEKGRGKTEEGRGREGGRHVTWLGREATPFFSVSLIWDSFRSYESIRLCGNPAVYNKRSLERSALSEHSRTKYSVEVASLCKYVKCIMPYDKTETM